MELQYGWLYYVKDNDICRLDKGFGDPILTMTKFLAMGSCDPKKQDFDKWYEKAKEERKRKMRKLEADLEKDSVWIEYVDWVEDDIITEDGHDRGNGGWVTITLEIGEEYIVKRRRYKLTNETVIGISTNILSNFNKYFMEFQQIFYYISTNILWNFNKYFMTFQQVFYYISINIL